MGWILIQNYPESFWIWYFEVPIPTYKPFMNAPTPHERDWIISCNEISIRWVTRNQAPGEL